MAQRSKYQQRIIKRYYDNQEAIVTQRLGEQVTELYLASGKGRARLWTQVVANLKKLKIPDSRIEHLKNKDDATLLAKLVEELLADNK